MKRGFRSNAGPSGLDAEVRGWLDRQHRAIEQDFKKVHDLDTFEAPGVERGTPQVGQIRYFEDTDDLGYGPGPYCYQRLVVGATEYLLWLPMFPPVYNMTRVVESATTDVLDTWTDLIEGAITVRVGRRVQVSVVLVVDEVDEAALQAADGTFRILFDGVERSSPYQAQWAFNTGSAAVLVMFTDTITMVETSEPYEPAATGPYTDTVTVTVQGISSAIDLVDVHTAFLELEEV